ncbi:MAG: hypothetical protein EOQ56_07675 [Mesorhizobium sp.]|nr:MAG: hypothetical protein EOQ56_07675 [Mesorhizobium sp.]
MQGEFLLRHIGGPAAVGARANRTGEDENFRDHCHRPPCSRTGTARDLSNQRSGAKIEKGSWGHMSEGCVEIQVRPSRKSLVPRTGAERT